MSLLVCLLVIASFSHLLNPSVKRCSAGLLHQATMLIRCLPTLLGQYVLSVCSPAALGWCVESCLTECKSDWPRILVQADKGTTLLPTKTLVPPPLEHLYCGLPSPEWQSDHMSLVTDFSVRRRVSKNSILLSGLHKEANMVRARSKLVDSEVFAAALAAVNRDKPGC